MANMTSSTVLIEKFWESIPPAWRLTRNQIRHIAIEKFQMTEQQFQVLRHIRKGKTSGSALAETSLISRSAISKSVDALVRRGLVIRNMDSEDRRHIPLALTEKGQRVMESILSESKIWLSTRFQDLDPEEMDILVRGMEILRKSFTNS
jgi:DNA-binding MarR family transcriptional regulator